MSIDKFIDIYSVKYTNTFHKEKSKSALSAISDFLFEPIFEIENFKIKKVS